MQKMKESETIKDYSDRLLSIANEIRLLGPKFADSRIVEKILVTVPERYEASITILENTKDLLKITLEAVLHALHALQDQEQRRLMRQDHAVEGALPAKHHVVGSNASNQSKYKGKRKKFLLVSIVENWVIRHSDVGKDQMQNATSTISLDMKR